MARFRVRVTYSVEAPTEEAAIEECQFGGGNWESADADLVEDADSDTGFDPNNTEAP